MHVTTMFPALLINHCTTNHTCCCSRSFLPEVSTDFLAVFMCFSASLSSCSRTALALSSLFSSSATFLLAFSFVSFAVATVAFNCSVTNTGYPLVAICTQFSSDFNMPDAFMFAGNQSLFLAVLSCIEYTNLNLTTITLVMISKNSSQAVIVC